LVSDKLVSVYVRYEPSYWIWVLFRFKPLAGASHVATI
jgi:hypothetical protein